MHANDATYATRRATYAASRYVTYCAIYYATNRATFHATYYAIHDRIVRLKERLSGR